MELNAKIADVVKFDEVIQYIKNIQALDRPN
jgi:hypothetical protein